MRSVKAVVSVVGKDQKGVVARFATYVAEHGINILDIEQQVVHGHFIMDMLVDLSEMTLSLDELITALLKLGEQIDMRVRVALHDQPRRKRVAILVSKEPHCLEELIDLSEQPGFRGEYVCVLGNHPDLEPIAQKAGIPFEWLTAKDNKDAHFDWLLERLAHYQPDGVALARYMQILPPRVVQAYPSQIINIHPSLLPYFPGARPYHQAWEQGVRVTGVTAHFVTEELDAGPVIFQDVFHIDVGQDTAEDVRRKGQQLEGRTLAQAVQMFVDEQLVVVDDKVVFRPGLDTFKHQG